MYVKNERSLAERDDVDKGPFVTRSSRSTNSSSRIKKCAASWEKQIFSYSKIKAQISFTVTAKLISNFVFATQIVQFLFFLNPKFQASNFLL